LTYHSSGSGCKNLSDRASVLVGEQIDGGESSVDYHSQNEDDHQANLKLYAAMQISNYRMDDNYNILVKKNRKCNNFLNFHDADLGRRMYTNYDQRRNENENFNLNY
jgi:hypothetical protein